MKPFRSFSITANDPGLASSDSAAPPTMTTAILPPPSLVQMRRILSLDTSHIPNERNTSRKNGNLKKTKRQKSNIHSSTIFCCLLVTGFTGLFGLIYWLKCNVPKTFKRQPHKMVKHTQTIRRQQPTNCLSVFNHFVALVLKGLKQSR